MVLVQNCWQFIIIHSCYLHNRQANLQYFKFSMSQSRSNPRDTPRRTPLQSRSYLNMPHGILQSPHNSGTPQHMHDTNSQASDQMGVIYGTNISMKQVMNALERFILHFENTRMQEGETVTQLIYRNQLNQLQLLERTIFEVQGTHLKDYDRQLYYQFIYFPVEMISFFDYVLKNLYQRFFIENSHSESEKAEREQRRDRLMMGIKHLDQLTDVKSLGPKNINRLICIRGIVIRTSEVYPQMKRAFFRCSNCRQDLTVTLDNAKVQEPTQCPNCKLKNSFELIHNLCQFTDKQYIKFQELPQYVADGQTPHSLTIICYDNNVDGIRPGDRVEIVGIYRAQSVKIQRIKSNVKSVFNTYIDLISFRILEENRFRADQNPGKQKFSDDQKRQFMRMAERPSIIEDLVKSFAPSIYGHEDVKKGILAQLFGGSIKEFSEIGRARFRSDINICLVGDPSTAKSQILQQVYKIAPRGIYTSGRGSSAVGLTANVRKDPQTREFILESGALVLSDLGICCIDQFDKMDQNSRTILLQAMQQQTISIAKAGIVCQLNSRTAILAAANPVHSKYDPRKSVVQNINLPPALLSRFDLIYIMLDVPNEASDKLLASHILDIYSNKQAHHINVGVYRKDSLAKYISYARDYVNPVLSQDAGRRLSRAYMEMRQLGNNKKTITATPRQLESLIRLSQSFAKMRLSGIVQTPDVEEAINLIKVATQQAATDPVTGLIDMDIITTGRTAATRQRVSLIANQIKEIMRANQSKYSRTTNVENFINDFTKHYGEGEKITVPQILQALKLLQTQDILVLFGQSKNNKSFKLQKDISTF